MSKSILAKSPDALTCLRTLEQLQDNLTGQVELLYSSLNVHESFEELRGIDFDFVRILLLARDLKINIRKRAIGSFFEWDKLDQAVGGRNQALGKVYSIPEGLAFTETSQELNYINKRAKQFPNENLLS